MPVLFCWPALPPSTPDGCCQHKWASKAYIKRSSTSTTIITLHSVLLR
jgi:hypothetical protein